MNRVGALLMAIGVCGGISLAGATPRLSFDATEEREPRAESPRSPRQSNVRAEVHKRGFQDAQLHQLLLLINNPKKQFPPRSVRHLRWEDIHDMLASDTTKTALAAAVKSAQEPGKIITLYERQKADGTYILHKDWYGECWSLFSQNLDPYGELITDAKARGAYVLRLKDDVKAKMKDLADAVKEFAFIYHYEVYEAAALKSAEEEKKQKPKATFYVVKRPLSVIKKAVDDYDYNQRYKQSVAVILKKLSVSRYSIVAEIKPDQLGPEEQEFDFGGMAQFLGTRMPKDLTKPAPAAVKTNIVRQKRLYRRESIQQINWAPSVIEGVAGSSGAPLDAQSASSTNTTRSPKKSAVRKLDRALTTAHLDPSARPQMSKAGTPRARKASSPEEKRKAIMLSPDDLLPSLQALSTTPLSTIEEVPGTLSPRVQKKSPARLKSHTRQRSRSMDDGDSRKAALRDLEAKSKHDKKPTKDKSLQSENL
ncbi:MAG: hypothetical protein ACK5O7_01510 [Holosporales bacterium]